MTTKEIANRLVELCREAKYEQAQTELYSDNIVSIEAEGSPNRITEGIEAVGKKGMEFDAMVEDVKDNEVSDPVIGGNFFSISMNSKMKLKGNPVYFDMNEICLFEVNDGKIIQEKFFYTPIPELMPQ